ncbi:hypothetical protein GCM10018793_27760 [Streptomyces sulfonofaciens]|uniref:DUF3558 domain-containing protein n=1 Tax=Streptomyces sulfonofaciens TaxID=68272 RepID=A0A919KZA5_9ACTN|nr:DUF3558 domain-containing protein [Streptomyces sulfonofaciens]GHH78118.1 hypothetical protein GCM10018793_27760 [Streptomyces sulfonofaciens]
MHRPAQRLTRILACAAAVPVILVASGCSSGSGDDGSDGDGASPSAPSASASAPGGGASAPPAYAALPSACKTLSKKTLGDLVPEADTAGTVGKSEDTSLRGTCSWNSLDNNGVKGSQFRWLNVSLVRFASDPARGGGDKLADQYYDKQVTAAKAAEGATSVRTAPVAGTGDAATAVRYDLKKKEGSFKQQTVVVRTENVVVSVDYNGAGLAGEKTPDADALLKDAEDAAKEVVAAVAAANDSSASASPSGTSHSSGHPSAGSSDSSSSSGSSSHHSSTGKVRH